ncbi:MULTISPECIES: hypothetical protein [Streptomyces]|uniref:RanBP2-type domain-containing protein n=1 Tax=Streptomyces fradiae ATCC 10745 = DSM 40063 TaxID=1319510 RepID=A0ABQ6XKK6_STRFR|nr:MULTISPECIES: hypothetical protein [Streptomyces]KAF0646313.1 hypothetical protein K701_29555 [Streptomyces fradiae ATCC 10745 = DSM 40063]
MTCWFCGADNPPGANRCGFCNHRADDGPNALAPLYGPDDHDALNHTMQLLGDDLALDHTLTGDWHTALRQAAAKWANEGTTLAA